MSLKRPEKENFRKNVQQMRLLRKANSSSLVTLLRKLNFRGIALQSKLNSCVMVNVIIGAKTQVIKSILMIILF